MFQRTLLVLTLCVLSISSLETCQFDNGEYGKCVDIKHCEFAINQVLNNTKPKTCGYNGTRPIVCCIEINIFHNIDDTGANVYCALGYPSFRKTNIGVGGEDALVQEFPHMAALGYLVDNKTVWGCGGTLITKRHVLTAAHCLRTRDMGNVTYVKLGVLNVNSETEEFAQNFLVSKMIKYPLYRPPPKYNDIAIIELDEEVQINSYVDTACLNIDSEIHETTFFATGWGKLSHYGDLAEHLQKMTVQLVEYDQCARSYENSSKMRLPKGIVDDIQICAAAPNVDTCPGDSGGPLQINTNRSGVVYGITSFGIACGLSKKPGIYTRVSNYIDWIESTIALP